MFADARHTNTVPAATTPTTRPWIHRDGFLNHQNARTLAMIPVAAAVNAIWLRVNTSLVAEIIIPHSPPEREPYGRAPPLQCPALKPRPHGEVSHKRKAPLRTPRSHLVERTHPTDSRHA